MSRARARIAAALMGLRGRMLLAVVATSLATLGASTLVVVPHLEQRLERDRRDELRGLARTIRPALRAVPAADRHRGSPALLRIVERLQRRTGGRIVVEDGSGTEIADTAPAHGPGVPQLPAPALQRALVAVRRDGVVAGERAGVVFAVTVAGAQRNRLTLVIAKRLDDSHAAAAVVRSALPEALLAGLTVAVVLALLVSRSLLRRLARLRADAEALGSEGLGHAISVTGTDEVSAVARALEDLRGRLVEEQASRQEFVSTASHELRTPLASLQATLELLREELLSGSAEPDRADTALRQTHRLVGLATDLLDLSRVDGAAPLELEPIELGELARTVGREFAARLGPRGRSVHVEGGPVLALADPRAAARIVRILLDNAANYGAGAVAVRLSTDAERVRLAVDDEGPGLAPGETERIFRRFARGRAAAGAAGGAGLGLPIARGLARGMGGDLAATPVARGARFVLTLRAADAVAAPQADHESRTAPSSPV